MGLKKLEEKTEEVTFLFCGDVHKILGLRCTDPGNSCFHFHSSLHCKIVSFSPYSEWVNKDFVATLKQLSTTGKQFGGILAAHSIATTLKYWYHGSPPEEIVSLGVLSEGKPGSSSSRNIENPPCMTCVPTSDSPPVYLLTWP